MRILIISTIAGLCAFFSSSAQGDPYAGLAWVPAVVGRHAPPPALSYGYVNQPSLVTFRDFFHHHANARFDDLTNAFGSPADQWDSDPTRHPHQVVPAHMPLYHGGQLFRYNLDLGAHVYIWTGEDDDLIMRADYFAPTGLVHPLFLRPL